MDYEMMILHKTLIRHLKGIVTAWEKWLNTKENQNQDRNLDAHSSPSK